MYKNANPLFLICETQLHAGSGDDLGIVDLPIQRERHTSFPKIEASSFKGAVREAIEESHKSITLKDKDGKEETLTNSGDKWHEYIHRIFGYDDKSKVKPSSITNTDFAGCIGFSDARLLLFPVKSMKGVFAWITCPRVLNKFKEDLSLCEHKEQFNTLITEIEKVKDNDLSDNKCYASDKVKVGGKNVILEEYAFGVKELEGLNLASELETLLQGESPDFPISERLVVLSDNDFKDFVNLSTEVITRTKIDNNTGTVATGALFTEEYLPSESILYTLVLTSDEFKQNGMPETDVQTFFTETINAQEIIQVGGNATLGKGLIRTKFENKGGAK